MEIMTKPGVFCKARRQNHLLIAHLQLAKKVLIQVEIRRFRFILSTRALDVPP